VVGEPSSMLTRRAWTAQVMDSLVRAGNAYLRATQVDVATGRLMKCETIPPRVVTWQNRDGILRPTVNGRVQTLWPLGDFIHIPATAFITAGLPVALSPVELAREQISTDVAAQRYVSNWYGAGGHPTSIVFADQELSPAQGAAIKTAWLAATEGRAPAVLGAGLKVEQVQEAPSADGFLDQMRFAVEQACRVTGVPPSMVYAAVSGSSVTYANVTDADLHFLKHSLGTWLMDLEDHLTSWTAGPQFVKYNVDALLRVTPEARHQIYKTRLESKTMTVDEVRNLEDEEPFGGEFAEPGIPGGAPAPMNEGAPA
jgi:HK97 family phage portal protein